MREYRGNKGPSNSIGTISSMPSHVPLLTYISGKLIPLSLRNPIENSSFCEYAEAMNKIMESEQIGIHQKQDLEAGRPVRKYWDDMDPQFSYTIQHIPLPVWNVGDVLTITVSQFTSVDEWMGVFDSNEYKNVRRNMSKQIKKYCESVCCDREWVPEVGEIIFVLIPSAYEIDNMRMLELGRAEWYNHLDRDPANQNPSEEDKHVGRWVRAMFLGQTNKPEISFGLHVRLIDYGRDIHVHKFYARKAVWRFMPFSVVSSSFILMIHGASQVTPALNKKWKAILRLGTRIQVRIVVELSNCVVVDLFSPTEQEFDEMYLKMLNGRVDESLLPIPNPFACPEEKITYTLPV